MVYSQTKRTSAISSITNNKQGGGSKKAGLPYQVGRDSLTSIMMHGTVQTMPVLKDPETTTVSQSRPIGTRPGAARYFTFA
tara:strand:+ start:1486 stop:1728 length:243 start_codon:yes stop_codon:yes gene_type:complete